VLGAKHGLGSSEFQNKAGVRTKKACASLARRENHEKMSTRIVGKKPNGKYQFIVISASCRRSWTQAGLLSLGP
jgi:hypothetical protein